MTGYVLRTPHCLRRWVALQRSQLGIGQIGGGAAAAGKHLAGMLIRLHPDRILAGFVASQ